MTWIDEKNHPEDQSGWKSLSSTDCPGQGSAYEAAANSYAAARIAERIALLTLESEIASVGAARLQMVNCRKSIGVVDLGTCLAEAGLSLHSAEKAKEAAELSLTMVRQQVRQASEAMRSAKSSLDECTNRWAWSGTVRASLTTDHQFTRDFPPLDQQKPREASRRETVSIRRTIKIVGHVTRSHRSHVPNSFVLQCSGGVNGRYEWRKEVVLTQPVQCASGRWAKNITKEIEEGETQNVSYGTFDIYIVVPPGGAGGVSLDMNGQQLDWTLPLSWRWQKDVEMTWGCNNTHERSTDKQKLKTRDYSISMPHGSGQVSADGKSFSGMVASDAAYELEIWPDGPAHDRFPRLNTPIHRVVEWNFSAGT
ncbi:hypothetical protein [Streptomyces europaeiscabiei]|uniref:hypothetical protein n=1 Tax=Streptomyces europaeiscabiei TaxID=146819 RepID=UPI0038F69BC1